MSKDQIFWNIIFSLAYVFLLLGSANMLYRLGKIQNVVPVSDLFLTSFAVFRLIRLFVYDSVFGYVHDYLAKFESGPRKTLSDLLSCPWCTGVWAALLVAFFYFSFPPAWYVVFILALAGIGSSLQIAVNNISRISK